MKLLTDRRFERTPPCPGWPEFGWRNVHTYVGPWINQGCNTRIRAMKCIGFVIERIGRKEREWIAVHENRVRPKH